MKIKLVYINIALFVILMISVVHYYQSNFCDRAKTVIVNTAEVKPENVAPKPVIYSIEDAKAQIGTEPASDMADAYKKNPKEKTGGNIVEAWTKVRPEDKAIFNKEIEVKIAQAKEDLQKSPDDKKAQHVLFIAEALKTLAQNDFNYTKKMHEEIVSRQANSKQP